MSGYSGRKGLSTGVHDPLYARVVAFESGTRRLVLVSTDLIGFYQTYGPIRDAICDRFDLKPCEIFLSGTHTHSGPTPTLSEDGHRNNLEYTQSLKAKLLEAIGQAIAIFCATGGLLDDLSVDEVGEFEIGVLEYIKTEQKELYDEIMSDRSLDDARLKRLRFVIDEYKETAYTELVKARKRTARQAKLAEQAAQQASES